MNYLSQLRVLVWKNFMMRRRQKFRCAIEFLWPMLLFIVLCCIRAKGLISHGSLCYFDAKAMPSSGFFAFLQSTICSFNNTCRPYPQADHEGMSEHFNDSAVAELGRVAEEKLQKHSVGYLRKVRRTNSKYNGINVTNTGPHANIRCWKQRCWKVMSDNLTSVPLKEDEFEREDKKPENNVDDLFQNLNANGTLPMVLQFFCGKNISEFFQPFETQAKSGDSKLVYEIDETYDYDNTTSLYCNNLMKKAESEVNSRILWFRMKPFVRGKILYTPDVPIVNELVELANETYKEMAELRDQFEIMIDSLPDDPVLLDAVLGAMFKAIFPNGFQGKDWDDIKQNINISEIKPTLRNISDMLDCFELNKFIAYETEEKALKDAEILTKENKLGCVLVFPDMKDKKSLPPLVKYKIRIETSRIDNTKQLRNWLNTPQPRRDPIEELKYFSSGFLHFQDMLDQGIVRMHTGAKSLPGILLQQFPSSCYLSDLFMDTIASLFPMIMVLSWVYSCAITVKSVVHEKEMRLKEMMHMMGLGNSVHWIGWFIDCFSLMFPTSIILTCILVYGRIISNSDAGVILVFLVCYIVATIMSSFLLSTLFSKANISAAAGGMIFFLLYLPHPFSTLYKIGYGGKVFMSFISNVAFCFGCSYVAYFERIGEGIHWYNVWRSPMYGDDFDMGICFVMLAVDILLYGILTWYIESAFPGEYGIPEKWYFPVQKSYWFGRKIEEDVREPTDKVNISSENFEEDPTHLPVGVSVQNLRKVYDNGKVAVQNLSINFYEDQITSFLGENGAGKTTTISILTGLFTPTRGTVKIYGHDILEDTREARKYLGVCPQYNVLFNDLTVEEHLYFYSQLKDSSRKDIQSEIDTMVVDLHLQAKKSYLAQNLSGGMKRKLSIGCAFIGGSRVVVLDEPTAGIDPHARRSIWELLLKYKKGHTIILTTHFMDEADILGDRIAIIESGILICCGTSLFMRSRFGSGYYLTLVKKKIQEEQEQGKEQGKNIKKERQVQKEKDGDKPIGWMDKARRVSSVHGIMMEDNMEILDEDEGEEEEREETVIQGGEQEQKITAFIQSILPSAKLVEFIGLEVTYVLPPEGDKPYKKYEDFFQKLDGNLPDLGVDSYGVADTTLEEIFLKAIELCPADDTQIAVDEERRGKRKRFRSFRVIKARKHMSAELKEKVNVKFNSCLDKMRMGCTQFLALLIKRYHRRKRNKRAFFTELILPALYVLFTLLLTRAIPPEGEQPALMLSPWNYGPSNYVFFSDTYNENVLAKNYEKGLVGSLGMGWKCISNPRECRKSSAEKLLTYDTDKLPNDSVVCYCEADETVCTGGAKGDPPSAQGATGDYLVNVAGRNISNWVLNTRHEYFDERYGGFTFGVKNNLRLIYFEPPPVPPSPPPIPPLPPGVADKPQLSNMYNNIKVWFNNKGWTSSAGYVNAVSNIILRAFLPKNKDAKKYGIQVISHPLSYAKEAEFNKIRTNLELTLLHAISVLFAFSFVSASFVVILVDERGTNSKHVQFVSGVNPLTYWLAAFFWDLCSYLLTALLCVLVFLISQEETYVSPKNFPGLFLLLLLYGWASIPLMYPATFLFTVPSTAFVILGCTNLFIAIISTLTTFTLQVVRDEELNQLSEVMKEIFVVFFPHFCLGYGLISLAHKYFLEEYYGIQGITMKYNCFDWKIVGRNIFFMCIQGFVYFFLTLVIEFQLFQKIIKIIRKKEASVAKGNITDEDVLHEKTRILEGDTSKDILVLRNLTKIFSEMSRPAVNQACVGVQKGDCFGLLGLNGAGKTTTFKMITGEIKPSKGDAQLMGYSIEKDMRKAAKLIGYCPQFDALDSFLTSEEHLVFYARIRGLQTADISRVVPLHIKKLGLERFATKCAGTYSGGNKRKLSIAIALMGDPALVLLDEPTSGMDPKARRFLWMCILKMMHEGRSVVLTSHSMDECEALCTNLTIMVNGEFRCLGSVQHLKNKFGGGYFLIVHCSVLALEAAQEYIVAKVPGSLFQELCHDQMKFFIPQQFVKLPVIFRVMGEGLQKDIIKDFSVNQVTLEDTFLKIVSDQVQP